MYFCILFFYVKQWLLNNPLHDVVWGHYESECDSSKFHNTSIIYFIILQF